MFSKGKITSSQKSRDELTSKNKRRLFSLILSLLLISPVILIQVKPTSALTIRRVPADYPTIQAAINSAASGDRIEVSAGTYYENIVTQSNQTSLTIVGANPTTTIVDGSAAGTVFRFDGPSVTLTGFTIRNAGSSETAITSQRAASTNDYHSITNNIIETNGMGISLGYSSHNTIFNNTFISNQMRAIDINNANTNNITGNIIQGSAYGIRMLGSASTSNTIARNTIHAGSYGIYMVTVGTGNIITRNTVSGRVSGIYVNTNTVTTDHNTVTDSAYGIYYYNSKTGTINYNILANNSYGIRLYWSALTVSSNIVTNNKIFDTDYGIEMVNSQSNTLTGNWVQQTTWGITATSSPYNYIYHNDFIDNAGQVNTDSLNYWNKTGQGNFWSDYKGKDNNADGIGDTPYSVGFGADYFPLMNKWWEHDILVQSVVPSGTSVPAGDMVNITVTVKNNGKISPAVSETFTVTAKLNSTILETKTVTNLAQGATQDVIFNWDTSSSPGTYIPSAQASQVTDELYTDNNKLTDGTVQVNPSRDVAVTNITASRTSAYLGYGGITINVNVKNKGTSEETFDVTVYHNLTQFGKQTTTLSAGQNTTLTFEWDTSTVTPGRYNIMATAGPLPGEIDTTDNTLTFSSIFIKIPGDLNGDHIVDIADYGILSAHWYPGPPIGPLGYDVNSDINLDGHIDVVDVAIVSAHWGQTEALYHP